MIKTVGYFPLQCAKNSVPVMQAILSSLKQFGITAHENSWDCDAVIVWSVLWHGRMQANRPLYEHYRSKNKPVIVIDIGALKRGETWKVAVNHVNALGYYGHTENLDLDRPKKLGITFKEQKPNDSILIAVQHRNSEQFAGMNVESWINEKITDLQKVSDRKIIVRPHPRSPINATLLPKNIELQKPEAVLNTYDSYDFDTDYHAVVNHNSGPGILAAISGARPIVDTTSLAHPVGIKIADIERPYVIDRSKWLIEICHTEYKIDELQQGLWLKRLKKAL